MQGNNHSLNFLIALVVLCAGCPAPKPTPSPGPSPAPIPAPAPPSDVSATAKALLTAHNDERSKAGVSLLVLDTQLNTAAEKHASWMASTGNMDHTGAGGSSHSDRIKAEGYQPKASGENIAMGYSSVADVTRGWMNSPGHRRNILNSAYVDCGFGMAIDSRGRKWWAAVFASPKLSKGDPEVFGGENLPPGIVADGQRL